MTGLDFSSVSLPFSAVDLLTAGAGILGLVGVFVMLGLAFPMAGKLIRIIRTSFGQSKA